LFCCENGAQSNQSSSLFFIGGDKNILKLDDAALGLGDSKNQFDMKSWSKDRKTLLLTRWKTGGAQPYIDAFFILKIGSTPDSYQLKAYPMEDGKCSSDAVMSPDGNSVISCEVPIAALGEEDAAQAGKRELRLYDISAGVKTVLYSSNESFGFSGPLNGKHESIYFTDNGRLLVWFKDGYKLFQLK
jgi:hypothetical protein